MSAAFAYGGKGITTNRLKGTGTEPLNIGWGTNPGALTHANTDTALFAPSSESRVAGTSNRVTTNANVPNDTYQVTGTITATAPRTIQEVGLFDTSTAAPQTTLAADITDTVSTSISITDATGFPGSGNYCVQVGTEVMEVTAGQGTTTWTVTRGARGSSPATHASGAAVVGGEACTGGNAFVLADHGTQTLNTGDSIAYTISLQYAG